MENKVLGNVLFPTEQEYCCQGAFPDNGPMLVMTSRLLMLGPRLLFLLSGLKKLEDTSPIRCDKCRSIPASVNQIQHHQ